MRSRKTKLEIWKNAELLSHDRVNYSGLNHESHFNNWLKFPLFPNFEIVNVTPSCIVFMLMSNASVFSVGSIREMTLENF